MNRLRTLIATALLTLPVLSLSAAVPTNDASGGPRYEATSAPPPGCIFMLGRWYCF
jgi:hypothetical protein